MSSILGMNSSIGSLYNPSHTLLIFLIIHAAVG